MVVKRNAPNGSRFILSNAHVLTDDGFGQPGDAIVQPAPLDGGKPSEHTIAHLFQWSSFQFAETGQFNLVDAAIAKVSDNATVSARILDFGGPTGINTQPHIGMLVGKYGRTSVATVGRIRDVNFITGPLRYKRPSGGSTGQVRFQDQVLCTNFTSAGDSGALVVDENDRAIGLHFSGSQAASVFNKIQHVLNTSNVDLVLAEG